MAGTHRRRTIRWALAAGLLALSLTACSQPQAGAVPMMTPMPTTTQSSSGLTAAPVTPSVPLDSQGFADPAFRALWQRTDADVASGNASRGWLWGTPVPFGALREPYAQAAGGTRLVQYFDKGRMELNDPNADPASPWYVTSGLLTVELVTGQVQVGDHAFQNLEPAQIPVAGDLESVSPQTPHYADYTSDRLARAADQTGQAVTAQFQRGQGVTSITPPAPVTIAAYDDTLGHNIPDVFTNYFNQDLAALGLNWLFVMGHPISEPYWITASFNGQTQLVLVQLFERRALAYNPQNQAGAQVEFTNIGLHYYRWRYHNN